MTKCIKSWFFFHCIFFIWNNTIMKLYLPWAYYTFCGWTIPSVGVLYLLWVYYTFHGCTIPSVGVLYLPWVYNTVQNVDFQRIICFFIWNMEGVANSGRCWENAYFTIKGSKSLANYVFLTPGGPNYLPINYRNYAHSPLKAPSKFVQPTSFNCF